MVYFFVKDVSPLKLYIANNFLRDEIEQLLTENNTGDTEGYDIPEDSRPYIILMLIVSPVRMNCMRWGSTIIWMGLESF